MKKTAAAGVMAALSVGLAACGHASGPPHPPSSRPSVTASPSGPLAGLSGWQIATKSLSDLKSAASVHYGGTVTSDNNTVTLNITTVRGKGCYGAINGRSTGGFQLRTAGQRVWIKPDERFLQAQGLTGDAGLLSKITGKWLSARSTDSEFAGMAGMCNLGSLLDDQLDTTTLGPLKQAATTVVAQHALVLRDREGGALYVTNSTHPYPLRITASTSGSSGDLRFDRVGTATLPAPPAPSDVVAAASLGL